MMMALVGAFSVIVKTDCETDGSFTALIITRIVDQFHYVWMFAFADLVSEFEQCGHHPPPQHSPASGEVGGGELALLSSS